MKDNRPFNILLADDDADDCYLFEKALKEIPIDTHLKILGNGEELIDYLFENPTNLPDVLFLDLSMPRKTGFECLIEIKENKKFEAIPVIVFTTSIPSDLGAEVKLSKTLMKFGAQDYVRKPINFELLKHSIQQALIKVLEKVD
jgi:CheY-like chemotaxis protein